MSEEQIDVLKKTIGVLQLQKQLIQVLDILELDGKSIKTLDALIDTNYRDIDAVLQYLALPWWKRIFTNPYTFVFDKSKEAKSLVDAFKPMSTEQVGAMDMLMKGAALGDMKLPKNVTIAAMKDGKDND